MGASDTTPLMGACEAQRVFDTLADPLFVLDVSQDDAIRVVAVNAACDAFFGLPKSQCINRLLVAILPPPLARRFIEETDRCKAVHRPVEFRLELPGAVRRAFGVKLSPITERGEVHYITAAARMASPHSGVDREHAEHFRVIAEHAADYISRCDREGRILYLNPAIERLTGATYVSLIGKNVSEWDVHLPHVELYVDCIRRVVATGKSQLVEMDFVNPATGRMVYHQIRYSPEWGPDGEVCSIIGVGRDITALKIAEAELRKLNDTLEERVAARTLELKRANSSLRSFASTVSHDLRAPLRTIRGYLGLLSEEEVERLSEDGRAILGRVAAAASKLDGLIDSILAYSQAEQRRPADERVDMKQLASEVAEELAPKPSRAQIDIGDLPPATADRTMVRQIFQNLIGNAIKFSAGRPRPQIDVGSLEQDGERVYYVRDNGVGFDMQYAHKLYSIFERLHTSDEFPGNGVGLAIVNRLVDRHGGRIWGESRTGEGATFYFTLRPRVSPTPAVYG